MLLYSKKNGRQRREREEYIIGVVIKCVGCEKRKQARYKTSGRTSYYIPFTEYSMVSSGSISTVDRSVM